MVCLNVQVIPVLDKSIFHEFLRASGRCKLPVSCFIPKGSYIAWPRHEYPVDYGLFGQHSVLRISPSMTGPLSRLISGNVTRNYNHSPPLCLLSQNWNDLSPPPPRFVRMATVDVLSDMRAALIFPL